MTVRGAAPVHARLAAARRAPPPDAALRARRVGLRVHVRLATPRIARAPPYGAAVQRRPERLIDTAGPCRLRRVNITTGTRRSARTTAAHKRAPAMSIDHRRRAISAGALRHAGASSHTRTTTDRGSRRVSSDVLVALTALAGTASGAAADRQRDAAGRTGQRLRLLTPTFRRSWHRSARPQLNAQVFGFQGHARSGGLRPNTRPISQGVPSGSGTAADPYSADHHVQGQKAKGRNGLRRCDGHDDVHQRPAAVHHDLYRSEHHGRRPRPD